MIDPLENGLFDMPDYEHTEDETFPPFPPPSSPGRGDLEEDPFGNREGMFLLLSLLKMNISVGFFSTCCFGDVSWSNSSSCFSMLHNP